MRCLILLQNAWSPAYAGREWPRQSWLRALHGSRSGKRLAVLTAAASQSEHGVRFFYANTTAAVGETASSKLPPDLLHIEGLVFEHGPTHLIACGNQSIAAWLKLDKLDAKFCDIHVLHVPHPAHRLLTDNLYRYAGRMIANKFIGRWSLTQRRGRCSLKRI
jgi:hypothetical protein